MAKLTEHVLAVAQLKKAKVSIVFHAQTKDEARNLIHKIGGRFEKNSYEGTYWVKQQDEQAGWEIQIFIPSMCQRVQVGETVFPATMRPAMTIPTYDYQCDQLFEVD